MKPIQYFVYVCLLAFITACGEQPEEPNIPGPEDSDSQDQQTNEANTKVLFAPTKGSILFPPNDLLFSGSEIVDGTLNIPTDSTDPADPTTHLNLLDGWSTAAEFTIGFSAPIDLSSIVVGQNLFIMEVLTGVAGSGVTSDVAMCNVIPFPALCGVKSLSPFMDVTLSLAKEYPGGNVVQVQLDSPLNPASAYQLIMVKGIKDANGDLVGRSGTFDTIASADVDATKGGDTETGAALLGFKGLIDSQMAVAAGMGIEADNVLHTFSFSTQDVKSPLQAVKALIDGGETYAISIHNVESKGNTSSYFGASKANVYQGTLSSPTFIDPENPLSSYWQAAPTASFGNSVTRFAPVPAVRATQNIPALITVPKDMEKPESGWPIVMYQHGITRNRSDLIFIADALAMAGFAAIAIDLPLHGLPNTENIVQTAKDPTVLAIETVRSSLHVGEANDNGTAIERTLGIDLNSNLDTLTEAGVTLNTEQECDFAYMAAAGQSDDITDNSGDHFINLSSLLSARDTVRQAVVDLMSVKSAIPSLDVDGDEVADFNPEKIYFVAHSLGALIGTIYTALDPAVANALISPVGNISNVLLESPTFEGSVRCGLQAVGLQKGIDMTEGSTDFASYMWAVQTIVDGGDPVNFAGDAGAIAQPLLVIEMAGTEGSEDPNAQPDNVTPPSVDGVPLSGTDGIAAIMGIDDINGTVTNEEGVKGIIRYTRGNHSSFLTPTDEAYGPIIATLLSFLGSDGKSVAIGDEDPIIRD